MLASTGFNLNTSCFCRDLVDHLDLLAKTDQMERPAPSDPLDLVDVLEKAALLYVHKIIKESIITTRLATVCN